MRLDYNIFVIQSDNRRIKVCFESHEIDTQVPVISIEELVKKASPCNTSEYYILKVVYEGDV